MSHCNYSEWAPVPLSHLSIKSKCVKALMDFCIGLYNWQKGKMLLRKKYSSVLVKRCDYRCVERLELKPAYFFCFKFQPLYSGFGEAPFIRKITSLHCENRFTCTDYFPFPLLSFLCLLLLIVTEKGESLVLRSLCGGQNGQQKPVNMLCNLYWPLQSYSVCAYQYKGLLSCPTTHIWHRNALRPTP